MKNVAVVTTVMDFSKQDEVQTKDVVCEQEYLPNSSYIENICEEEGDSVNNVKQWPMRHNKESEQRFPFTCNGYHSKTRAARITCTGRITRIPSRYLDTEPSDDYSTMVSRLKVKRRRKSSNNKLLVNGCTENNDVFPLKLPILHPENLICNLDSEKLESLANFDYPEVFNEPSLISNKKTISPICKHEAEQTGLGNSRTSNSRRDATNNDVQVKLNGLLCGNSGAKHGLNKEVSICSSQTTTTSSSVDICKDNGQRCPQSLQNASCFGQSTGATIKGEENVVMDEKLEKYNSNTPSSTREFVSSKQMSCTANLHGNNDYSALRNSENITVINNSLKSSCMAKESGENEVEFDELPPCSSEQKAAINTTRQEAEKQGLNYFKNLEMARRKFGHKKKRRGPLGKNKMKKHTDFNRINIVNNVKNTIKPNRIVNRNEKGVDKLSSGKQKTNKEYTNLDQVLGMRHGSFGGYEFLVEWANGTSCWVSAKQIVDNKHNGVLRKYLMEQGHDISVVKRVPFEAYCCDSLSLKECPQEVDVFDQGTTKCPVSVDEKHIIAKKEVLTEINSDCYYIMLMRETCKRKLTSLKIVNDLIEALEDASVTDCSLVVLKGLGGKIFAGFDVDTVCKVDIQEKGNEILQRIRYLVQTLSNYPKPIIGLISQPAEGIGAAFLSLFDMICDEAAWEEQQIMDEKPLLTLTQCCLPRSSGYSVSYEDILMGKNSVDEKFDVFSEMSCDLNDNKDILPVMNTLSHIKSTLKKIGQTPNSLIDITSEGITQMTKISFENSLLQEDMAIDSEDIPSCSTDDSSHNISSCPADRYVKELETKISEEKHLVQKYIDEISTLWNNNPSSSGDQCSSSSQNCL